MLLLLVGFLIGVAKSLVPLGPTGVLVFERGLERRYGRAMSVALGGVIAEFFYCLAAVLGLQALAEAHPYVLEALREAGIVVVLAVGSYLFFRPPRPERAGSPRPSRRPSKGDLAIGFSTAALNPAMLFTWSAVVAVLISVGRFRFGGSLRLLFPLSVASGTLAWDVVLVLLLGRLSAHLSGRTIAGVVRALGVVLIVVATWQWAHPAERSQARDRVRASSASQP